MFERLCGAASRRPILTVGIVLALALGGGLLALGLRPSAGIDTFVSSSSASYKATADDQRHFGDEAVVILIRESLPNLVETKDLGTLTELEACLAGQYVVANSTLQAFTPVAAGTHAAYGGPNSPCGHLMKSHATQVVYGPGTFLNRAVSAVNTGIRAQVAAATRATQAAEAKAYQLAIGEGMTKKKALQEATAAGRLEYSAQLQSLEQLAVSSGLTSVPSIDDPSFIPQIVFDQTRGVNQPKARFSYLFPTKSSALIQVRLRASLSDAQQAQAISWIRQAINMPMFRSAYGGKYTITGVPVVINDLASQITGSIAGLLIAALLVMAATLLLVFRNRFRLLPLAVALGRHRHHVRSARGAGRHADDGLDRRAADPHRPRRRLRDPVPGPRSGGADAGRARRRRPDLGRAGGGAGGRAIGSGDRHGGAGHRHRLPRPAPLPGADGARLRAAVGGGHLRGVPLRPDRGLGGAHPR